MSRLCADAHILWMELEGEIYSPAMPLRRATLESIERDLWNGAYAGVCHAVYSYGAYPNGGSYCRDVTQEVAARLGETSFAAMDEMSAPARAFLEAMGVACREERGRPQEEPAREAFEMVSPPEPVARSRRNASKRRSKAPTPQELRAQPQLKLPIAGGKSAAASRAAELIVESEHDEDAGVDAVSLRDTRPLAEQRASWDRFRAMVRSWRTEKDGGEVTTDRSDEPTRRRRSSRAAG